MPKALPVATLPIAGLEDQLTICWLAYTETRLTEIVTKIRNSKLSAYQSKKSTEMAQKCRVED